MPMATVIMFLQRLIAIYCNESVYSIASVIMFLQRLIAIYCNESVFSIATVIMFLQRVIVINMTLLWWDIATVLFTYCNSPHKFQQYLACPYEYATATDLFYLLEQDMYVPIA